MDDRALIVAALVNRNDAVGMIDALDGLGYASSLATAPWSAADHGMDHLHGVVPDHERGHHHGTRPRSRLSIHHKPVVVDFDLNFDVDIDGDGDVDLAGPR